MVSRSLLSQRQLPLLLSRRTSVIYSAIMDSLTRTANEHPFQGRIAVQIQPRKDFYNTERVVIKLALERLIYKPAARQICPALDMLRDQDKIFSFHLDELIFSYL